MTSIRSPFFKMKLIGAFNHYFSKAGGERMPSFRVPQRRSMRVMSKRRASLVINLDRKPQRLPCLVLDSSKEGFRLRGSLDLRRGQVVELILDEDIPNSQRCSVVWVGKAGSKQEGEIGLEIV
jgi:hypothetical protein